MAQATLERQMFSISRDSEYFEVNELEKMTGQRRAQFADVVIKELLDNALDNALDAAEYAGVAPAVALSVGYDQLGNLLIIVRDSGAGISAEAVSRILDFSSRTSDKLAYRTPTRGLQGNAMKTIVGIPSSLQLEQPVIITAQGLEHQIRFWVDPAGALHREYEQREAPETSGTMVQVPLPYSYESVPAKFWADAFSLFNPHAFVFFEDYVDHSYQC